MIYIKINQRRIKTTGAKTCCAKTEWKEKRKKMFLWMQRDGSIYRALWVRTRESRGGLSERGKGGLLHSQLVELGQLLKG